MIRSLIIILISVSTYPLISQDTLDILGYQNLVLENHPLIKRADLYEEISESYLLKGKGALDPKLFTQYDAKQFKDQNYFSRWNSELKIPTKYPVDFSLGYENNSGAFLNNDNNLPSNGLIYGTINISVLRGLLFDDQRFLLNESQLMANKNEIEKEIIIRNIIIQSIIAYIDWSSAYSELELVNTYLERVRQRHSFIIQLFENGDKPAIDTLESRINLNTATKDQIFAQENLLWKSQKLNMFLWSKSGEPLALLENVVPQLLKDAVNALEAQSIIEEQNWNLDPLIRKKQNKAERISLENKLEREMLKPQLDIKLNTIHSLGDSDLKYSYSVNDYKVGATIEVPIRNRKTKGQIRLNEARIDQNILDQSYYRTELQNKYITLLRTQVLNSASLEVSVEKVSNSNLLYEAERLKFELGESSVFLLNSRERKLLEAQSSYIKNLKALGIIFSEFYFLKIGQTL